jgi:hypothetical protein
MQLVFEGGDAVGNHTSGNVLASKWSMLKMTWIKIILDLFSFAPLLFTAPVWGPCFGKAVLISLAQESEAC